ncbi:hypothetical protein BDK51DRAFT_28708 [Blyttiomyces helicus]|uniref:Uncharacterized protein n=1 Tax=Blyttiomyces helicus TaxID=388810 RepID=A0A4P9WC14_9FUNG|nr:hypothetical protein BDK51DRAFT_28708 [Blyttiomyces helicus]|eukprot:RKO88728.1 hypothetical protein BDK51DRAFT_28708 [Blyttiomyces helicus]
MRRVESCEKDFAQYLEWSTGAGGEAGARGLCLGKEVKDHKLRVLQTQQACWSHGNTKFSTSGTGQSLRVVHQFSGGSSLPQAQLSPMCILTKTVGGMVQVAPTIQPKILQEHIGGSRDVDVRVTAARWLTRCGKTEAAGDKVESYGCVQAYIDKVWADERVEGFSSIEESRDMDKDCLGLSMQQAISCFGDARSPGHVRVGCCDWTLYLGCHLPSFPRSYLPYLIPLLANNGTSIEITLCKNILPLAYALLCGEEANNWQLFSSVLHGNSYACNGNFLHFLGPRERAAGLG